MNQPHPDRIWAMVADVDRTDGEPSPFNSQASLIINGEREGRIIVRTDGDALTGVLVADAREQTLQVAVHPSYRCQGLGTSLLGEGFADHPDWTAWAFGNRDAARGLARALGLVPVRELLQMERPLGAEPAPSLPEGYELESFTPEATDAVVEVNRLAFRHHPEQGQLTVDDFRVQASQDWFDPDGLLLARAGDGQVAGFHWIKRDGDRAEVYVLAVHPDHEGRGLGRSLLEAGLHWMQQQGCTRVHLYVEAAEARVVRLYEAAGFEVSNRDVSYAKEQQ